MVRLYPLRTNPAASEDKPNADYTMQDTGDARDKIIVSRKARYTYDYVQNLT